jgi:hypothetical protein
MEMAQVAADLEDLQSEHEEAQASVAQLKLDAQRATAALQESQMAVQKSRANETARARAAQLQIAQHIAQCVHTANLYM